jgi:hypothetical protein
MLSSPRIFARFKDAKRGSDNMIFRRSASLSKGIFGPVNECISWPILGLAIFVRYRTVRASTPIAMLDPVIQYQEALAKAEELKEQALQFLTERRAAIEKEIATVEKEIAAMTGETLPKAPKAPKFQGKQISFRLLADMLKDRPDRTMSPRREGYDTQWIKRLVAENPDRLTLGGNGPWPTVTLVGT